MEAVPPTPTDLATLATPAEPEVVPRCPSKAAHLADVKREIAAQHAAAAAKQAERGKRGAHERVLALLDEGSFQELGPFVRHRATQFGMEQSRPFGDGVVTGFGEIDGRPVAVFSQDFSVFGGSLGEAFAEKLVKLMDLAERYGCPIIGIPIRR